MTGLARRAGAAVTRGECSEPVRTGRALVLIGAARDGLWGLLRRGRRGPRLQRVGGVVLGAAAGRGVPRHAQLVRGVRGAGLALRQPDLPDPAPAARRHPRLPAGHPLRGPGPANGRVRTDLAAEGSDRNKVAEQLPASALRVADRVAGGVGLGELKGTAEPFLCHTLCELGAEPLEQELKAVASFLKRQPGAGGGRGGGGLRAAGDHRAGLRRGRPDALRRDAAAASAAPDAGAARGQRSQAARVRRGEGRVAVLVHAGLRLHPGHPARGAPPRPAQLRPLPRHRRQPAAADQPLDPAVSAEPRPQRTDRPIPFLRARIGRCTRERGIRGRSWRWTSTSAPPWSKSPPS